MAVQLEPKVKKEIVARLKRGDSTKDITADYGDLPWQTVAKIKREIGILAPMKRRSAPKKTAALSLDDVRENVRSVIGNLEQEKEQLLARVKELDDEIDHAQKILGTMS